MWNKFQGFKQKCFLLHANLVTFFRKHSSQNTFFLFISNTSKLPFKIRVWRFYCFLMTWSQKFQVRMISYSLIIFQNWFNMSLNKIKYVVIMSILVSIITNLEIYYRVLLKCKISLWLIFYGKWTKVSHRL